MNSNLSLYLRFPKHMARAMTCRMRCSAQIQLAWDAMMTCTREHQGRGCKGLYMPI